MKRRNPRFLVLVCAVAALLVVPSLAVAAPGPGLGFVAHQGDSGWSLTAWFSQLGSSLWSVLTYDALQQDDAKSSEIEKLGVDVDPNGNRRFSRVSAGQGDGHPTNPTDATGGG